MNCRNCFNNCVSLGSNYENEKTLCCIFKSYLRDRYQIENEDGYGSQCSEDEENDAKCEYLLNLFPTLSTTALTQMARNILQRMVGFRVAELQASKKAFQKWLNYASGRIKSPYSPLLLNHLKSVKERQEYYSDFIEYERKRGKYKSSGAAKQSMRDLIINLNRNWSFVGIENNFHRNSK